MYFMPLYIDGRERTRGTHILTGTAAYATALVDSGDRGRQVVVGVKGHHLDGTGRTMAGTVAALHAVVHADAVLLDEDGMAYLDARLLLNVYPADGTGRTDL
jgi:hypothetical protein